MSVESTAPECRATGPRTAAGKRRSRMNAIKHGSYSKHLLLEGEDRSEFERLYRGLRSEWQPVGVGEMLEVEHLAGLYWRRRRDRIAQTARISRSPGFVGTVGRPDLPNQHLLRAGLKDGSTVEAPKVVLLEYAAEVLYKLSEKITESELEREDILLWLHNVYAYVREPTALCAYHKIFTSIVRNYTRGAQGRGSTETTDFVSEASELILAEAKRFHQLRDDERLKDVMNTSLASLIPSQNDLDSIIRRESHSSREIDRSINRLRQLQRERRSRSSTIRVDLE